MPFYYGFDEQLKKTIEFLKTGNYLNVDLFALKKADEENMIAPLGSVPFELEAERDGGSVWWWFKTRILATR